MSDIKHIKFDVPVPVSKTRKSRKTALKATQVKPTPKPVLAEMKKPVLAEVKKPVINVNVPYGNSPHTPSPAPLKKPVLITPPVKVIQKPVTISRKAPLKVNVQPNKRKNFTMKRKFVTKKITINVENVNKIKNKRETIEKTVANMSLPEVTAKLRANGLVRPTANPPEKMQRGWMVDFMMFQVPL